MRIACPLKFHEVSKRFGSTDVLVRFNMEIHRESILGLLGRNGVGKTTILRLMHGAVQPDSGLVSNQFEQRALLPQRASESLFPYFSIHKNLCVPLMVNGVPRHTWKARVEKTLNGLGLTSTLTPLFERMPFEVSGGQQQLTCLARALVEEPRLLLLDEPAKELDFLFAQSILTSVVRWVNANPLRKVVITSHNLDQILQVADRIVLLDGAPAHVAGDWLMGDSTSEFATDGTRREVSHEILRVIEAISETSSSDSLESANR